MLYPPFLKEKGSIGFVAPSFGASFEPGKSQFESALKHFKEEGYTLNLGPNVYKGDGVGISTKPSLCAKELEDYYADISDVLISVCGGELMNETLGCLNIEKIAKARPKWFLGYSDNTHFGFLLPTLFDTASLYGPIAMEFGLRPMHESLRDCEALLTGKSRVTHGYEAWQLESLSSETNPLASFNLTKKNELKYFNWRVNEISGRFLGGCLDVLLNLCGTKYDKVKEFNERYKADGIIWFLEACELSPLGIRRGLWHLEKAGWFDCAKAFVFGRPMRIAEGKDYCGVDEYEAAKAVLGDKHLPIIMDADIGHLPPMMTMINGAYGRLSRYKENNIQIQWELI